MHSSAKEKNKYGFFLFKFYSYILLTTKIYYMQKKNYEEFQMGFDRTQLFKEHIQPQINRAAAISAVTEFCKLAKIEPTMQEYFLLVDRFILFIETGDKEWVKKVDTHFQLA